jgi:hypothetical protein
LGVGDLRPLSSLPPPCPYGAGAAHHPMGSGDIERHAPPLCAVPEVRAQGSDLAMSRMGGEWCCRLAIVPTR